MCDIHASVCKTVSSLGQLCCLLASSSISSSFDSEIQGQIFSAQFSNAKAVWHAFALNSPVILQSGWDVGQLCSYPSVHLELVFLKLPPQFQCWPLCHLLLCYPLLRCMASQVQRQSHCEAVVLDLKLCMNLASCHLANEHTNLFSLRDREQNGIFSL